MLLFQLINLSSATDEMTLNNSYGGPKQRAGVIPPARV